MLPTSTEAYINFSQGRFKYGFSYILTMKKESLEKITQKKEEVRPVVEKAMDSFLGLSVPQLTEDISDKLAEGNLNIDINLKIQFKQAKEDFKKNYLIQLLNQVNGNVSEAARIAGLDRRSIHRLIEKYNISVEQARQAPLQFRDEKKDIYVKSVIESTLKDYDVISEEYKHIDEETTKEISKAIPEITMTIDLAVMVFEKAYLLAALDKYGSQKDAAKAVGLRYETFHKKCKELGLL